MGYIFAILSPALVSITNYIDKFVLEKYDISPIAITVYSGCLAFFIGVIIALFSGFSGVDGKSAILITISGILTGLYVLPYFKALTLDETSRVVPLYQIVSVFILILSFFLLGERLQGKAYIGSILIVAGGFLISIEKPEAKIFRIRPAFWYMMLSSFIYACSIILYKFGVKEIPFWKSLPFEGTGMLMASVMILSYKKNFRIIKKETKLISRRFFSYFLLDDGIYIASRYTSYFALTLITASTVGVLSAVQPFFVLLYGVVLTLWFPKVIKEVINKEVVTLKIISLVVMFIGIYLLTF